MNFRTDSALGNTAVSLQVICANGDFKSDLLRDWARHAQSEIMKKLHFCRAATGTEKKKETVSKLSYLSYLFQDKEVQIWRPTFSLLENKEIGVRVFYHPSSQQDKAYP